SMGSTGTSTERNYGLEKILYRIRRNVWFHLRVWIHLVRKAHAWRVYGSPRALATGSRLWQSFFMACFRAHRDVVLFYAAYCEVRTCRWPPEMCPVGTFRCAGLRGRPSDHLRCATNHQYDPLGLERGCLGAIRGRWRNHWRDL